MKALLQRIAALIVVLATGTVSYAATQAQIDQTWNKGLAWTMTHQHGDGGWSSAPGLGIQATASAVQALANVNLKNGYTYLGGVSWLSNAEAVSVDALSRQIAGLMTAGEDLRALGDRLFSWRNYWKGWGAYAQYGNGLPDTPLAIMAMMDAWETLYDNYYLAAAVCTFIDIQLPGPNYLWPYTLSHTASLPASQRTGAIVPTVYAVQALHKINTSRFTGVTCKATAYTLSTAIDHAITGLLAKRKADNGFGDSSTSTVIETALVYQVLRTLNPFDAATGPALDYLIARQAVDGSWGADALQTAVVLSSLPAPTPLADTDKDGIPDGVETILGKNPNLPDSRFLALGAGSTVTLPAAPLMVAASSAGPTKTGTIAAAKLRTPNERTQAGRPSSPGAEADVELFIAGGSGQVERLMSAVEGLLTPETLEVFHDDGGLPGSMDGDYYRAFFGTVKNRVGIPTLAGKKALIHFAGVGGSYAGVGPVARAGRIERMALDDRCIDPEGDRRWSCPRAHTVPAVPDAGISEAPPAWHVGRNLPAGEIPITRDELAELDAVPIYAGLYGVAATQALGAAGLTSLSWEDVAELLSGAITTNWSEISSSLPQQPILICRLSDGAQPAANALFLGIPCDSGALAPIPQSSSLGSVSGTLASPAYLVVEGNTVGDVVNCLNRANDGGIFILDELRAEATLPSGSFAVGVLPLERQPGVTDHWAYLAIDGPSSPTKAEALLGRYPYMMASWMLWRKSDRGGVAAPRGDPLVLLQKLRQSLASPGALKSSAGAIPLRAAPGWVKLDGCKQMAR